MSTKRLLIFAEEVANKIEGKYGGKGKFELPSNHKAAMQVTKGGSCCKNCKYVDAENHECNNKYYIQWNESKKLPDLPLDEICSDWWEPHN